MLSPRLLELLLAMVCMVSGESTRRGETLVSTQWLADKLKVAGERVRVVHSSWTHCADFDEAHIPGAVCFDGEHCRDTSSPYKNMLPTAYQFAKCVGQLGIDNTADVVIYDSNENTPMIVAGTRLWYTFRVFGYDRVRLLNGGLKKWKLENRPVTTEQTKVLPKTFNVHYRPELVLSYEDVLERVAKRKELQLVDVRPERYYRGDPSDPYGNGRMGHIRNAVNIPFTNILNETGLIREDNELAKLFRDAGVDLGRPLGVSCGTGMSATGMAFSAYLLGKDVPVYDGSWYEWARRAPDEYIVKSG